MYFKDILGQEAIKRQFITEALKGRIAHAQLICGPEGTGKLPLAIAFARYICCTNKGEADACGHCPSCIKFNNVPHDTEPAEWADVSATKAYSDIDYPLIRLGEIYLIYAEACMHLDQVSVALPKMEELAERAGVEPTEYIDTDFLIAERARELMWEGHRRTDLIRYEVFNSARFTWPYKGNSYQGTGFPEYMNIFAIPLTDLAANVDLEQNPGYADLL